MPSCQSFRLLVLLALACLLPACMSAPQRTSGEFVERSVAIGGVTHRYQVFAPASRAGDAKAPVILFLH